MYFSGGAVIYKVAILVPGRNRMSRFASGQYFASHALHTCPSKCYIFLIALKPTNSYSQVLCFFFLATLKNQLAAYCCSTIGFIRIKEISICAPLWVPRMGPKLHPVVLLVLQGHLKLLLSRILNA